MMITISIGVSGFVPRALLSNNRIKQDLDMHYIITKKCYEGGLTQDLPPSPG
jgi:hypothetical protein